MNESLFLGLIYNASLLLAMVLIFDVICLPSPKKGHAERTSTNLLRQISLGLLLGGIGMTLMLTPWEFAQGIIFDTRSVLLGISGLFFGLIPTVIAMVMTAVLRIFLGGPAALTGVFVILATGSIGLAWRHWHRLPLAEISWRELYLFGLLIHFVMLALMFMLPWETALKVLADISLPVLIIYPLGTTLLGMLLANRLRRTQTLKDLARRSQELGALFQGANAVLQGNDFNTTMRHLFDAAREMTEAQSGYVALANKSGEEDQVLLLESGGRPCTIDLSLPIPMSSQRTDNMPAGRADLCDVLLVPLQIEDKTEGVIALGNKPGGFSDDDRRMAEAFGKLAAIALRNSQNLAALTESEERLQSISNNTNAVIFMKDSNGRYLYTNQRWHDLFHTNDSVIQGKTDADIFPQESAEAFSRNDQWVLQNGQSLEIEELVPQDDGLHTYLSVKFPLKRNSGEIYAVCGIATDITERKQAETEKAKLEGQLQQAQKMESVGRLAGGVAHDFNNMLGVIMGHTEMALMKVTSEHPLQSHLLEISKAAERSANLTRQLLAFSRKQTIAPRELDINETVTGMLKMLQRLIGEDIDLVWQPQEGIWQVLMDPSQLDQILANLCVNARDAILDVGKITIETANNVFDEDYCAHHPGFTVGDYVRIAISDSGCGMDKEMLTHIFEPFFTSKEFGKGTGLGLATVYGAIKQNNGFITVYSEPGQGTTFSLYLPRLEGKAELTAPTPRLAEPAPGGQETILLTEDEPVILEMTTTMLQMLGYTVLAANSPYEAIRLAQEHAGKIHLLMTDVVMPEMNGRDLATQLLSSYPQLKCLFMSGYTADVIAHHGVLDEGVCFIQKPFAMDTLAAKVRQGLAGEQG